MSSRFAHSVVPIAFLLAVGGCATQKESFTARTGVEQLLISSAVDQSLDKVDLSPLRAKRIFLETKYLECVDKNYIIVAMHHRLMNIGAKLVDKPDEAETIVEIGSGGVGTDSDELFVGIPEIPLPPPSPIAIPRLSFFTRNKLNGTAKLLVVAYDAKTKTPVINHGSTLARSDQKTWHVLASGTVRTGSVPDEIAAATGQTDFNVVSVVGDAKKSVVGSDPAPKIRPVQTRPAQAMPVQAMPVQTTPVQSTPVQSTPSVQSSIQPVSNPAWPLMQTGDR